MLRAQDPAPDLERLFIEETRIVPACLPPRALRQVGHRPQRVGMLRTEDLGPDLQRLFVGSFHAQQGRRLGPGTPQDRGLGTRDIAILLALLAAFLVSLQPRVGAVEPARA